MLVHCEEEGRRYYRAPTLLFSDPQTQPITHPPHRAGSFQLRERPGTAAWLYAAVFSPRRSYLYSVHCMYYGRPAWACTVTAYATLNARRGAQQEPSIACSLLCRQVRARLGHGRRTALHMRAGLFNLSPEASTICKSRARKRRGPRGLIAHTRNGRGKRLVRAVVCVCE